MGRATSSRGSGFAWWRAGLVVLLGCFAGDAWAGALGSVAETRAAAMERSKEQQPVEFEAVVTFSKRSIGALFVHDGEAGIFVEHGTGPDEEGPRAGDRVRVSGVTGEGWFAPVVTGPQGVAKVDVLGEGELPVPRMVEACELAQPEMDSSWVSVEAAVREVTMVNGDVVLECEADDVEFDVLSEGPVRMESVPWSLAEARVRISGVVATRFNAERQMTGRYLRVNSLADVVALAPSGAGEAVSPPVVRAADLFRYGGPGSGQVVRLRGVTTMVMPGRGIYLRTEDGGVWVQTAQPVAAAPGTALEVEGWPRIGEVKPFLRARKARVLAVGAPPEPVVTDARGALRSGHEAELVTVAAELLGRLEGTEGLTLELRDGGMVFRAMWAETQGVPMQAMVPGSRLRVTGIARITPAGKFTAGDDSKLTLHLRNAADIVVVAPPPFWTVRHVLIGSGLVILAMVGGFGVVRAKRKREQEAQRREFEAVLAERGRFAREIHDSLAQGLTSISLQLEYVRDCLATDPEDAAAHIETARGLVRDSLREARRTVWNLRPLALGEADLATAFRRLAAGLAGEGRTVKCDDIEGTPRPLPPDHEAALLRIGQEALTNAAKHSQATEIRLRLRFGPGWVTLTVKDNGKGFDVASKVGKGYGLTGMHERVAGLGGSLSIDSCPGQGTEVSATFPD